MADNQQKLFSGLILESPPAPESPASGAGLLADETLAVASSKIAILEALWTLTTRALPFHDFMRELLLSIMKVVKSEAGSILELDHDNQSLFFRATVGQSSDTVSRFVIPFGQGVVGYVAESRQPLTVDDVGANALHLRAIQKAVGFEPRNLVAVPIIVRGKVYGVLELLNRVGNDRFTAEDVELLVYVCGVAARAIEVRLMIAWALSAAEGKSGRSVA